MLAIFFRVGRRTFLVGIKLHPAPRHPHTLCPLSGTLSFMCHLANFFSAFMWSSNTFKSPSWILPSCTHYLPAPLSLFSCSCTPQGITTHSLALWRQVSPTRLWAPQAGTSCPVCSQQHPGPALGTQLTTSQFAPLLLVKLQPLLDMLSAKNI